MQPSLERQCGSLAAQRLSLGPRCELKLHPLLNKAMFRTDEEGNSLPPIAMELPPDLEARIQHRVFEALARFEH